MLEALMDLLTSQLVRVRGASMSPAPRHGGWVRVSRRAYRRAAPARFDIVRFSDPARQGRWAIKRVIGQPGERLELSEAGLKIDGRSVNEPHLGGRPATNAGLQMEWFLGPDDYLVLGDNRAASTDSRSYGPIPRSAVTGRVGWPL